MDQKSTLCKLTAAVLSCILCCTGGKALASTTDETGELPARFDLRDEGAMTSVKHQYHGSCGIFSAMAAIESNMIKQGMADSSLDISEEHFSWFTFGKGSPDDPDDPLAGDRYNLGTEGYEKASGFWKIIGTLACWTGVVPASWIPQCEDLVPIDESLRYASVAHLQNATKFDENDRDDIKRHLMEKGAVQLAYFSIGKPEHYSSYGAYYQSDWNYFDQENNPDDLSGGGHAVCICGWDDNFPKEYFIETPPGDGAWICKNSWGPNTTAGIDGYTYISYYDTSLHDFIQYEMEPTDNYDSIYQLCGGAFAAYTVRNMGWEYANIYTAKKDENLTAVSIILHESELPYEISIYALNDDFENPRDGKLLAQISGTEKYAGYRTYPLHTVCQVSAGQKFSAVVKTGIKPSATIFFDKNADNSGTSFYRTYNEKSQGSWKDSTTVNDHGNTLVKVFTKEGIAVNSENYPNPLYRQAILNEYDKNEDYVITDKELTDTEPFIRGDINRDGIVNSLDLSLLKQVSSGSQRNDLCLIAGDWNDDKVIDEDDVQDICDFLLGKSVP